MTRPILRQTLISLLVTALPALGAAQATPTVAPVARVYADVDRLAALGLIDTIVAGPRPYSRREIVRLLAEARRNLDRAPAARAWASAVIDGDLSLYAPHALRPLDALTLGGAVMRSPYRVIPADGNGSVDASINPLAADREGRPLDDGATAALETFHSADVTRFLAVQINPRWTSGHGVVLQSGAADLLFSNLSLEVGRDYAVFGQAPEGGLLLSDNAPALDMLRVSNDEPFVLPWLFHWFGPIKAMLVVADLGTSHQTIPHAKVAGYHVALEPWSHFELGVQVVDEMGGEGGPAASFGDRVLDLFPFIDEFRTNSDFAFSNKLAGGDLRWRMPSWRGFELYAEGDVDDFDGRRVASSLLDDGGYLVGVSFSCLAECGRFGLRAEYHQTGIRYYTHLQFPSGLEDNGALLGDPLGPRGLGSYLSGDYESPRLGTLSLTGAYEVRSGNLYASTGVGPHDADFHFVQLAHRPGEGRARLTATWAPWRRDARFSANVRGGVERVTNESFIMGATRTNALAELTLVVRP